MKKHLLLMALALLCVTGCLKVDKDQKNTDQENTRFYLNAFAYSVINTYYLWKDEVSDALAEWEYDDDPTEKVKAIRYKDTEGNEVDKWTMLTDDYSGLVAEIDGVTTTYGLDYSLYYTDKTRKYLYMVVNYTAEGSPARKAGLKRGDVIKEISSQEIAYSNYSSIITESFLNAPTCTLTLLDGSKVTMTAVEMYEDPVLLYKVFSFNGKKVGYLVYNSFTLKSWERLTEAGKYFRQEGIEELILDLRYNSGGYVKTEQTLASMLAPRSAVESNEIFEKNIYNDLLQQYFGDTEVRFTDSFSYTQDDETVSYSTADANFGISKMYVIFSKRSASASESLIVGLRPYVDIEIIGENSSGKYCSGIIYPAYSWTVDNKDYIEASEDMDVESAREYTDNWGIYLMVCRFADVYGETPCMPDGFTPDYEVSDSPVQGWELGDERETMLNAALTRAGKTDFIESSVQESRAGQFTPKEKLDGVAANGYSILEPGRLF